MEIVWQRVGHVVSGSGSGTKSSSTSTTYPVPIVGPGGIDDLNGTWILYRGVDSLVFRGGTVSINGNSFNFLPQESSGSTGSNRGLATSNTIRFTFSYRLI